MQLHFCQAQEVKVNEVEFNPEFISRMIQKLDWPAFCKAVENVRVWSYSQLLLMIDFHLWSIS